MDAMVDKMVELRKNKMTADEKLPQGAVQSNCFGTMLVKMATPTPAGRRDLPHC